MNKSVIFETPDKCFRILEIVDETSTLDDLKGDTYEPESHPDIPAEQLECAEREFNALVEIDGVFGYVLEKWDASPGAGYTHVDSCWGFVGAYSETDPERMHYIVEELKSQTKETENE